MHVNTVEKEYEVPHKSENQLLVLAYRKVEDCRKSGNKRFLAILCTPLPERPTVCEVLSKSAYNRPSVFNCLCHLHQFTTLFSYVWLVGRFSVHIPYVL